jgi:hypothetical protein
MEATHLALGGAVVAMITACCIAPNSSIQKSNLSCGVVDVCRVAGAILQGLIVSVGFAVETIQRISQHLVRFAISGGAATLWL